MAAPPLVYTFVLSSPVLFCTLSAWLARESRVCRLDVWATLVVGRVSCVVVLCSALNLHLSAHAGAWWGPAVYPV